MKRLYSVFALVACVTACSGKPTFSADNSPSIGPVNSAGFRYTKIEFAYYTGQTCTVDTNTGSGTCINPRSTQPPTISCNADATLLAQIDQTLQTIQPIPTPGSFVCVNNPSLILYDGSQILSFPCNYTLSSADQTNLGGEINTYLKACGLPN